MWSSKIDGLEQGGPPPAAAAVGMGERPSSSDDGMCCKIDSSVCEDADRVVRVSCREMCTATRQKTLCRPKSVAGAALWSS